jgi:hypothetical protein
MDANVVLRVAKLSDVNIVEKLSSPSRKRSRPLRFSEGDGAARGWSFPVDHDFLRRRRTPLLPFGGHAPFKAREYYEDL